MNTLRPCMHSHCTYASPLALYVHRQHSMPKVLLAEGGPCGPGGLCRSLIPMPGTRSPSNQKASPTMEIDVLSRTLWEPAPNPIR